MCQQLVSTATMAGVSAHVSGYSTAGKAYCYWTDNSLVTAKFAAELYDPLNDSHTDKRQKCSELTCPIIWPLCRMSICRLPMIHPLSFIEYSTLLLPGNIACTTRCMVHSSLLTLATTDESVTWAPLQMTHLLFILISCSRHHLDKSFMLCTYAPKPNGV